MKNIQIIDGADNCTHSLFQATDNEFAQIFPGDGQDLEFVEDLIARLGETKAGELMSPVWSRPIVKREAHGIHGTLYYDYAARRVYFPATKREIDWNSRYINQAQRDLFKNGGGVADEAELPL